MDKQIYDALLELVRISRDGAVVIDGYLKGREVSVAVDKVGVLISNDNIRKEIVGIIVSDIYETAEKVIGLLEGENCGAKKPNKNALCDEDGEDWM